MKNLSKSQLSAMRQMKNQQRASLWYGGHFTTRIGGRENSIAGNTMKSLLKQKLVRPVQGEIKETYVLTSEGELYV